MNGLTAEERKCIPIFSGVIAYFPKALAAVAVCSKKGNDQHNPGSKLHWDRDKSGDELDALSRHLVDAGKLDSDGIRHSAKVAWRALANLEKELERAENDNEYKPSDSPENCYNCSSFVSCSKSPGGLSVACKDFHEV